MAYSTDGETYSATVNDGLHKSMDEERYAVQVYKERADAARDEGDNVTAQLWEHIAEEERGHYNEFKDRLDARGPRPRPADYMSLGDIQYPPVMHRPFPETYGDWVNLAEDIKAADPGVVFKVNYNLHLVSQDLPGAEEAKRWLMRKAGELGIS